MSALRSSAFALGMLCMPVAAQRPDGPSPAPPGEVRPPEGRPGERQPAPGKGVVPPPDIRDIVSLTPSMKSELERLRTKISAWATQQAVVGAATQSAGRSLPDIPEDRWRRLGELDQQVRPFVRSDVADYLRSRIDSLEDALLFAELRDPRGLPIAASAKPFLFDASRREAFVTARGREAFVGEPERNLVTQKYWVSISVPVLGYAVRNGRVIPEAERPLLGVLEVGVDLRYLARHVVGER